MIFHTAAESVYYNAFFKRWHRSILQQCPDARFSLRYVGDTNKTNVLRYTRDHKIELIIDSVSPADLVSRYGSLEAGKGYYPMARWNSIPDSDNVCVTDVDVVMVRNNLDQITELLKAYDFVSISRPKVHKTNFMMVNFIKQNCTKQIRDHAASLMDSKKFRWDIDLEVMEYMKKNYKYTSLNDLKKFDEGMSLIPRFDQNISFGYYSSVAVTLDGIEYKPGVNSKRAKYKWAEAHNLLNFSNNQ